ncbi:MAG: hypothetical protein EOR66_19930 [Mesorhizobium sp.]|uniref:DUF5801 repeats-in-toxin domain-containing protein n=2 Tax=Mesorhizobium sp. TaxID=1871066 RepID=UPI000FE3417E|nr:DUF5801 repeats-in-toxin domain-containing protein [Mesorhizobium sp.]RWH69293.1 MAG: hypothetical protein EOQ84_21920 [Mesorhizobium sp.]RWL27781.1 MAG: hypothetical protein EOR58_13995 [Mesorhizobium sp.]RWL29089.1 MAG: hypothetical protein EOR63_19110 [Mesorhizobium sp.]RWL34791.1 MAG: hypothetical protein EOR59_23725 [Mesorhizobium sp.]RWL59044.1 MAG: hypothetical protein EOR64_27130 [Mesorhizobium sp.]
MATTTFTINGNLIIDESASVQTSATDNDTGVTAGPDNEVAWQTLLANMSSGLKAELDALTLLPANGETAGDTSATFPQAAVRTIGSTSSDFIQLNTNTITDLQFSDSNGNKIADGTATQIFATHNGAQIFLYADASNNIVYGREGTSSDGGLTWTASSTGTVAFAIVMDDTTNGTNVTGGNVWTIQYEALKQPNTSGIDDADTSSLSGLVDVKAIFTSTTTANFGDFSHVPSGSDEWAAIEQTKNAGTDANDPDMIITGLASGSKVTVSTQGLGNNSQALNSGEAVRVDVVNHVNYPDFPLTNPDVHDLSKLSYTSHVDAVTEGSFSITQVNPGSSKTTVAVHIWAFNELSNLQGAALVSSASIGSGGLTGNDQTLVQIIQSSIKVWDNLTKSGNPLDLAANGITVTAAPDGKSFIISGLKKNYTVDFQVNQSDHMDRFVVGNAQPSGSNVSFDAGNFTFNISSTTSGTEQTAVGGNLLFEDGGPTISASTTNEPTLTVSEATLGTPSSGAFGGQFTVDYKADGPAASNPTTYALSTPGGDSGLIDTLTGQHVQLSKVGSQIVGTINNGTTTVFTVSVDGTGQVTLTQSRAVVQATGSNPDTGEGIGLTGSNLVVLTATATDGDGDSASTPLDLTPQLQFTDVGPTIAVNDIGSGTYTGGGNGTWSEAPGADGFKSLAVTLNDYTIDSHPTVTVNSLLGTDTTTDANGNYVFNGTINADFNNDGTSDAVSFKLTFNPTDNTYKIDVTSQPSTIITFDTSQGSLAPGGPDPVQTLTFSSGPAAGQSVVFFGAVATADPGPTTGANNDIFDLVEVGQPDLTKAQIDALLKPTNQIPTLINGSTQMNVSTSGIGINNNNLDGSGAGIQSTDESFVVNPSQLVDKVKVFIDNSVGGYDPTTEDLEYRVYYSDGTVSAYKKVQAGDLSPVTSGVANGGKSFEISDVLGGPQIDAVQLTMANGTIKVPVIQFSIRQAFLPQQLAMNLTATLTDGDNDTKQDPFSITLA